MLHSMNINKVFEFKDNIFKKWLATCLVNMSKTEVSHFIGRTLYLLVGVWLLLGVMLEDMLYEYTTILYYVYTTHMCAYFSRWG